MLVKNYYLIGNLTVPSSWIALLIAFVIAYGVIRFQFNKQISEKLSDYIFIFILVWKLSVVLTNFETVIRSPLTIIYFHGGRMGILLALFVVGIKGLIDLKKKKLQYAELRILFVGSVMIQAVYQLMMVLLNGRTTAIQIILTALLLAFALYVLRLGKRGDFPLSQFALLFLVLHVFIGSLQLAGIFGMAVVATMIISLFFILLNKVSEDRRREIGE